MPTPSSVPSHSHALVTGASSGIGRELSLRLARRGIHVVAAARRTEALAELVEQIQASGGTAEALALDVEDFDRTERIVRERSERRAFDLVVANAGTGGRTTAAKPDWPLMRRILTVNVLGATATIYGALPAMLAAGRGHLVGISSLMGLGRSLPQSEAYAASKAALTVLFEGMSLDLVGTGIFVTTVLPGFVKTEMTAKNKFKMPFLLEVGEAADIIDAALVRGERTCAFPLPTSLVSHLMPLVPGSLYEGILRRMGRAQKAR
jgi:short-subunit dehydrogenase